MDIAKIIKSAIGDSLTSKLGIDSTKTSGIMDTISGVISDKGVDNINETGPEITSELESKNGLSADLAGKVSDMVLPLIIKAVKSGLKDKLGSAAGNILGKFNL